MLKKQEVELDLITLKTTKLPYSFKQGDANVHEITLKLKAEDTFEYERAQVCYSTGDFQDIESLTFIIKNSALKPGRRTFEVEFVSGEEVRRSGKVEYYVDSSINSKNEAFDKYNELKKLYDVYVDAVNNEVEREQLKVELIELKNSIKSDLQNINLVVDDIVGSENDRKQNEVTREEIKAELENLVTDIQNMLNNGDFVGEKGEQGLKGDPGEDGYTPIKGVDYFDGEQGPPGKDGVNATATNVATISENGLMSSADKTKLDGVEAGAEKNTITSVQGRTGAVTVSKSDVGLSNVNNVAITQADIDRLRGMSLDLFMTEEQYEALSTEGKNLPLTIYNIIEEA